MLRSLSCVRTLLHVHHTQTTTRGGGVGGGGGGGGVTFDEPSTKYSYLKG